MRLGGQGAGPLFAGDPLDRRPEREPERARAGGPDQLEDADRAGAGGGHLGLRGVC